MPPHDFDGCCDSRDGSDGSLYIPMRRRSLIQTPGVATRVNSQTKQKVEHKPKAEHRHSTMAALMDSPTIPPDKHISLPISRHVEPHQRAITPCDRDYQLGGIKFGTLRITNGAPTPSPAKVGNDSIAHKTGLGITPRDKLLGNDKLQAIPQPETNSTTKKPRSPGNSSRRISASTALNSHPLTMHPWLPNGNEEHDCPATSKCHAPAAPTQNAGNMDYLSPEVFHVRDAPNAKSQNEENTPCLGKTEQTSVTRSDSGFVSSSTTSSSSSRAALSNADSGYSSNFSLRSLRSNSREKHQNAEKKVSIDIAPMIEPASGRPGRSSAGPSRGILTLMSRDKGRRKPSKVEKYQEAPQVLVHARTRSADEETSENKQYLLRRLISSPKRRSISTTYTAHDSHGTGLGIAADVGEELWLDKSAYPATHRRAALGVGSSQETLQTIMSVDSLMIVDHTFSASQSTPQATTRDQPRRRRESHALDSAPGQGFNTKGRWTSAGAKSNAVNGRREATLEHPHPGGATQGRQHRDNSRSRKLVTGSSSNPSSPAAERTLTKPDLQPGQVSQGQPLKPRLSLPDLATRPLPPLPVSSQPSRAYRHSSLALRASSLKASRVQSLQAPSVPSRSVTSTTRRTSQEGLRSLQGRNSRPRAGHIISAASQQYLSASLTQVNCQPPLVYRQSHFRDRSGSSAPRDEQGRPYRILHSYNSPAYRNSPIWG